MGKSEVQGELRETVEERHKLLDEIAEAVHEQERLTELIAKAEGRDPSTEARQQEVVAKLKERSAELRKLLVRIDRMHGSAFRLGGKAEELRQKLENFWVPKVHDLKLEFNMSKLAVRPSSQDDPTAVGHHTAGPTDRDDEECVELFIRYHLEHKANGWAGEGYHYGLSRAGTIFLLRPTKYIGAHTYGFNDRLGVVCHGTTGDKPTLAQARTFRWLLKNAHTKKMPSSHRSPVKLAGCVGHNDLNATECPGTHKPMYVSGGKRR